MTDFKHAHRTPNGPSRGHGAHCRRLEPRLRTRAVCVIGLALSGLLAGCQSPSARQRMRQDADSANYVATTYAKSEARRPGNLAWMSGVVAADVDRNARDTAANPGKIAGLINRDVKRFEERQPDYWKTAGESLWGHPEKLELTATQFVY